MASDDIEFLDVVLNDLIARHRVYGPSGKLKRLAEDAGVSYRTLGNLVHGRQVPELRVDVDDVLSKILRTIGILADASGGDTDVIERLERARENSRQRWLEQAPQRAAVRAAAKHSKGVNIAAQVGDSQYEQGGQDRGARPRWTLKPVLQRPDDIFSYLLTALESLPPKVVEAAVEDMADDHEEYDIYITSRGMEDYLADARALKRWQEAIRVAMNHGYHVCHLLRLKTSQEYSLSVIQTMLRLVDGARGTYQPYILRLNSDGPIYDLALFQQADGKHFAIISFATTHDDRVGGARITQKREEVTLWRQHFKLLMSRSSRLWSAFKSKDEQRHLAFRQQVILAERRPGDRLLVQEQLPELTRPHNWYRKNSKWANRKLASGRLSLADLTELIAARNDRRDIFRNAMQQTDPVQRWRDVIPMQAIEDLSQHGYYKKHDFDLGDPLDRDERIKYFDYLIELLDDYDNYQLIIVPNKWETPDTKVFSPTSWLVKGDYMLMEHWFPGQAGHDYVTAVEISGQTWITEAQTFWFDHQILPFLPESAYTKEAVRRTLREWRSNVP